MKIRSSILALMILFGSTLFESRVMADEAQHATPKPHSDWSFSSIGLTPTLNGGRIKPLDSFAREVVLFETGSRSFESWNALDLLFSWIAFPDEWEIKPFIKISREDVRKQLGLDEDRILYSPQELFKNSILSQYAQKIEQKDPGSLPPGMTKNNPREQELKAVLEKISLFRGIVTGQSWLLIPSNTPDGWGSLLDHSKTGALIQKSFMALLKAYQAGDQNLFGISSNLLRASVEGEIPNYSENFDKTIYVEQIYNQTRPFLIAWIFYLISSIAWGFRSFVKNKTISKPLRVFAWTATTIAVSSHIFGFGLRCFVAGRPPVTNMYESIIWVSLGIVAFATVLYGIHRQSVIYAVSNFLACFGLVAGDAAPAMLDPSLHPLVPVLRSNYWLTIHVLTITLGYAAFALTLGLANISLFQFAKKAAKQTTASLNQLTYRAMQFGVVFIAAGTILGGIWADYSWGRFWGWDPKEVWALITLLCYLVILHGRFTSWMGQFGFAACSAVSFLSVLMAWYGVNFVLGVGLHSYGFSSGGTPWVLGFVALELTYVLSMSALYFRGQKTRSA